jgi:hypothetical protein
MIFCIPDFSEWAEVNGGSGNSLTGGGGGIGRHPRLQDADGEARKDSQDKPCPKADPAEAKDIAKRVGGKITLDHPGSPTAKAYITFGAHIPSYARVTSRLSAIGFSSYLNINPEHYGGMDFKGHGMDGNWYHVTVGYPLSGRNDATNASGIIKPPSGNDATNRGGSFPFDTNGRVPWVTIHCENGDPGSIFHG